MGTGFVLSCVVQWRQKQGDLHFFRFKYKAGVDHTQELVKFCLIKRLIDRFLVQNIYFNSNKKWKL